VRAFSDHPVRPAEPDLASVLYTGPFHVAFRTAVHERGLTLDRLRAHLARRGIAIGLSSLSDWQQGRRRPGSPNSMRAVRALEEILGLPQGILIRLLVEPPRPGTRASVTRLRRGYDDRSGALGDLLDELPGSRRRDVVVLNRQEKLRLDAAGRTSVIWLRMAIQASQDGADRYVLHFFGDTGCAVERVRLSGLETCRLGRVKRDRAARVLVAELLFDEALRAGQTWVLEVEIRDGTAQPCTEHAHGFRQPGEQYLLEVRFDPAALPVECHAFAQPGLYEARHRTAELTLNSQHAVHLLAPGTNTGLLGIGWSWP
jgi:hypothetical protein